MGQPIMMLRARSAVLAVALQPCFPALAPAGSLQVAPVGIEVAAPGAASSIKLRNEGATPINAQIRVFRWIQAKGEERLEPTGDVVASPPMVHIGPGAEFIVRLVRVTKQLVSAEESYRL